MTGPKAVVVFRSREFNSTEQRPYFVNEGCFGDDVARWLMGRLRAIDIDVDPESGQEDFGWYFNFVIDATPHCFVVGSRPVDGEEVEWVGWLERKRGFVGSILGLRSKGILSAAALAVHAALRSGPKVADIRWHAKERFDRGDEAGASAEP